GQGFCGPIYVDAWSLSNANGLGGVPVWSALSPSGAPTDSLFGQAMAYLPSADRVTSFGGLSTQGFSNDVLTLEGAIGGSAAWSERTVHGQSPSPRMEASAVMAGTRLLMFGGLEAPGIPTSDVWSLLVDDPAIVDVPDVGVAVPGVTGFAR